MMTYTEMMEELEAMGELEYMCRPEVWINDHKKMIKELLRHLLCIKDGEKRQQIFGEIRWRTQEIELLKQKLAS